MNASVATTSNQTNTVDNTNNTNNIENSPEATRRPRLRLLGLAIALLTGLLAPLLLGSNAASAATFMAPRTATEISIAHSVFHQLNAERAANHLPALHWSGRLGKSSRVHNMGMARMNTMSHQLPGEADFGARIDNAGYHWTSAGENIAWNSSMTTAGAQQVQLAMYNERAPMNGHRLNILSRKFSSVGVDIMIDRAHGKLWLTTDFGNR